MLMQTNPTGQISSGCPRGLTFGVYTSALRFRGSALPQPVSETRRQRNLPKRLRKIPFTGLLFVCKRDMTTRAFRLCCPLCLIRFLQNSFAASKTIKSINKGLNCPITLTKKVDLNAGGFKDRWESILQQKH